MLVILVNAMFDFFDVEQNSPEWYNLRAGKFTSSNAGKVMANIGKAFGEPAKKYAVNIAIEQITGNPISSEYSNVHMERGHEQEPIARSLYEDQLFCDVDNGGFFGSEFIGCSPDGLVGKDGVIEIKSVIASVHFNNIKRGGVDPAYKWQCICNLLFTGREWIDFVSYCSEFPIDNQLYIYRMEKTGLEEEFNKVVSRVSDFKRLVDETRSIILEAGKLK